nr:hypothetical protein [Ornithinimicrobium cryptoxanthini]
MTTVFLAMPNLLAIAAFGTPSAASLLINAHLGAVGRRTTGVRGD